MAKLQSLEDLPVPQPYSKPGEVLGRQLGTATGKTPLWVYIIFGPLIVLLVVALGALLLVLMAFMLLTPSGRDKIAGGWLGFRRPIAIEASADLVSPGDTLEIAVRFMRPGPLQRVRVLLRCTEHATYRRGTDSVTDTHVVEEIEVLDDTDPHVSETANIIRCEVEVPPAAMHSFRSTNNKIEWEVVVERTFAARRTDEQEGTLVVLPLGLRAKAEQDRTLSGGGM